MNNNLHKSKTTNFYNLLNEQKIEIPIIQRDYAQGRKGKEEIRKNFLNALHKSIQDSKPIKLDFIYGSNLDNIFQPLDGQQRLTTLFLLHWYAAMKDEVGYEDYKILQNFTYETRISSRDFCKELISHPIPIQNSNINIRKEIIDSPWFYLSWKHDPTIDAMLRTLDDIHAIFNSIPDLWKKLTTGNHITFYYVELENIGLTDDLYIKMNARGKLLSSFENFKAGLQKKSLENQWEEGKQPTETFAFKIDTNWTDFFWKYFRKSDNTIDEAFIRFISTVAMVRQSIEKDNERINIIRELQRSPKEVRPDMFTRESFEYLIRCFDIYSSFEKKLCNEKFPYPLWRHAPKTTLLNEIAFEYNQTAQTNSASYTQKVLFFAQTEYLTRVTEFNPEHFYNWMRVIRNIVSRGNVEKGGKRPDFIRSPESFDGAINLINELAEGCYNIYEYLAENEKLVSSFAKDQIDEERVKAKLIFKNEEYKEHIHDVEDTDLLMGKIRFAFECVDYIGLDQDFPIDKFIDVKKVLKEYFGKEKDLSNDIRRSLFTIEVNGEYKFYDYWSSWWNVGNARKRCLIENFRELEYYISRDKKEYLRKLIIKLIDYTPEEIIENFIVPTDMPKWQERLIKEPNLLDKKNKSNYIAIPENNNYCYLLKGKRPREIKGCYKVE